jgi:endogenous inhibitor of DNA gyrase (YacG/DUF329 family)
MFELAVTVNLACADCGKTSVGDGFVNTDVPDLFEQGRGEALLQVECPHCRQWNSRFVKKADLDALRQVDSN